MRTQPTSPQMQALTSSLAGAFQELLRIIELTMRESMHRELTITYGEWSIFNPDILDDHGRTSTTKAVKRAGNRAFANSAPEQVEVAVLPRE